MTKLPPSRRKEDVEVEAAEKPACQKEAVEMAEKSTHWKEAGGGNVCMIALGGGRLPILPAGECHGP